MNLQMWDDFCCLAHLTQEEIKRRTNHCIFVVTLKALGEKT